VEQQTITGLNWLKSSCSAPELKQKPRPAIGRDCRAHIDQHAAMGREAMLPSLRDERLIQVKMRRGERLGKFMMARRRAPSALAEVDLPARVDA